MKIIQKTSHSTRAESLAFVVAVALVAIVSITRSANAQPEQLPITPEFLAILRGSDTARVSVALDQGASPNARDHLGNTPLMHAAIYSDRDGIRLLLDRGADVNATNHAGATALMRAAFDPEKVALLLDRGANVQAHSALGNTALMLAARTWNSHIAVEMLLSRGADANATNLFGATALMAAAAGGDVKSVELLLKHGANPNSRAGADPVAFIFGGGRNALMWSAYRGNVAITQLLLDAGADVNAPGFLGTPLGQAAWANRTAAAELLINRGANPNLPGPMDGYSPLHWAASTEDRDPALLNLLLAHGADPNLAGGEHVDAFMSVVQTPLMLARRRGETPILSALLRAGATKEIQDRPLSANTPARPTPDRAEAAVIKAAISQALPPLQATSIESKQAFVRHSSRQDCTSCHQQMLPMAAIGLARKLPVPVDKAAEQALIEIVRQGEIKDIESDLQALFHPEPVHSKGYTLLAFAAEDLPADAKTDAWVHHLSVIQGKDGQWFNNLPRPPIQTDDIGATALAIHALQLYPLPGRKAQLAEQVGRARRWLWTVTPENNEGQIYQILGLAWAGEPPEKLSPLVDALNAQQQSDGGWAQLPGLASDAYATGQAVYALRVGGRLDPSHRAVDRGLRFLLGSQLEDGTWHVRRRAFPFQPTMNSGFPHGRDSWISAAASSWAVMALSVGDPADRMALRR